MEIQKELNTYYQNLMFEGKEYLNKIQTLPLKSNNAIDIAKSLDRLNTMQRYIYKRIVKKEY